MSRLTMTTSTRTATTGLSDPSVVLGSGPMQVAVDVDGPGRRVRMTNRWTQLRGGESKAVVATIGSREPRCRPPPQGGPARWICFSWPAKGGGRRRDESP